MMKLRNCSIWTFVGVMSLALAIGAPSSAFAYKKADKKRSDKRIKQVQKDIDDRQKKIYDLEDEENRLSLKKDSTDLAELRELDKKFGGACECKPSEGKEPGCPKVEGELDGVDLCLSLFEVDTYKKLNSSCKKKVDACGVVALRKRLAAIEVEKAAAKKWIEAQEKRIDDMNDKFSDGDCEDCTPSFAGGAYGGVRMGGVGGVGLGALYSDRDPTWADYLIGGLQVATPLIGMGLGTYMQSKALNSYGDNYQGYLKSCATVGVPCLPPGGAGGGGWGGGGWGGGMMMGGSGGFWPGFAGGLMGGLLGGNGINGGIYIGGNMGGGMPGYPGYPMIGGGGGMPWGYPGGGGGLMIGGNMGVPGGWGMPMMPYGYDFNSAMFPYGNYGNMGGGGGIFIGGGLNGGGGMPWGYPGGGWAGGGGGGMPWGYPGGGGGWTGGGGGMPWGYPGGGLNTGGNWGGGGMPWGYPGGGGGAWGGLNGSGNGQYNAQWQASMQQQQLQMQRAMQNQQDMMSAQQQLYEAQQRLYHTSMQANTLGGVAGGGAWGGGAWTGGGISW